jgi:hypothetical protein
MYRCQPPEPVRTRGPPIGSPPRWDISRSRLRRQGHGWHKIGDALDVSAQEARRSYLERVEQQRRLATEDPELGWLIGYEPRLAELAEPNDAGRAHQAGRAEPGREGGP